MIIQITKHHDPRAVDAHCHIGTRRHGHGMKKEWYESLKAGSEMVRLFFILFWQQTNSSDLAFVSGALVDKSGLGALG